MKKVLMSLVIVAGLSFSATSCKKAVEATDAADTAGTSETAVMYTVDTASVVEWKGNKITGKTHNGTIAISSGEVSVVNGMLEAGTFTIDMNSINVLDIDEENGKSKLEAHLKGTAEGKENDFFNVKQFPEAKFEITAVEENKISGNLTLKGETKNISFPAKVEVNDDHVTITSEAFMIDRTQWGVNFGNESLTDIAKENVISNNIEIKFVVKATK